MLQEGKSLTLQVFGEMQKFTVKAVECEECQHNEADDEQAQMEDPTAESATSAKREGIKVVTESTEIIFAEDESEQNAKDGVINPPASLDSFMDVEFAGFEEQLNTLEEVIQIKLVE